jgi:uncharacterized protein (DUF1330 family)
MTAYAIAHLHRVDLGPEIAEYLMRIDDTLPPFEGRFLVHGQVPEPADGVWEGSVVVIEFPSMDQARGWYASPAYQAILPLRLHHSQGEAILVGGVAQPYRAAALAGKLGIAADA